MSKDNAERVAAMTDEEREDARRQIVERFGANVGEILKRASLARTKQQQKKVPPAPDIPMESVNAVEGNNIRYIFGLLLIVTFQCLFQ